MQPTVYSSIDRYLEVFCGKDDIVEGSIYTESVLSCTVSYITCDNNIVGITDINRKSILSMAHACNYKYSRIILAHQKLQIDIMDKDIVALSCDDNQINELGVVMEIDKQHVKLFYLSGNNKGVIKEVSSKYLRFIGRGFNIEKYYELKENRLSLEYTSLYTYLNRSMIPSSFQEEIGIPKIVYNIGDIFPIVASLTGRIQHNSMRSHDDTADHITRSLSPKRTLSQSKVLSPPDNHTGDNQTPIISNLHNIPIPAVSSSVPTSPELRYQSYQRSSSDPQRLESLVKSYQTSLLKSKERLVQMWLNINEKMSPERKKLKEASRELYVDDSIENNYNTDEIMDENTVNFPSDSTHYLKSISGNRKSEQYRNFKSDRKACPRSRFLNYADAGSSRLSPIPLTDGQQQRIPEAPHSVRFSVNVICHEYPSG